MSKTHEASPTNGDSVQIKLGGDFVRKTLPYLLAGSVATGGWAIKAQYDSKIEKLESGQSRIEGKVDLLVELAKEKRRGR